MTGTCVIFVGPTLTRDEINELGQEFVCLPPVKQGDMLICLRYRPCAIGIIDGLFSGAPAVWHKEILWALAQGVRVYGSASMGALRAAELEPYGMQGVGSIFAAFRSGDLEDDDEVAVVHAPAELGFRPLSEPMVNVRATLRSAREAGVISEGSRRALQEIAKKQFFAARTWTTILEDARASAMSAQEFIALSRWLPQGKIDQKRLDALEMLKAMVSDTTDVSPPAPSFRFEWTHHWDTLLAGIDATTAHEGGNVGLTVRRILEELRLEGPKSYESVKQRALLRHLANSTRPSIALQVSPDDRRAALEHIRLKHGLSSRAELISWLADNKVDALKFDRLIDAEARLAAAAQIEDPILSQILLDELRLSDSYRGLRARAEKKQAVLDELNCDGEALPLSPGVPKLQIRLWFFHERLGFDVPDDLERFARQLGFRDCLEFDGALQRELLFFQHTKATAKEFK